MFYVTVSCLLFLLSVSIHLGLYRNCPQKGAKWQIILFLIVFFSGLVAYTIMSASSEKVFNIEMMSHYWDIPLGGSSAVLYVFLMAAYFVFMANAPLESPSQKILLLFKIRGELTYADLQKEINNDRFIRTRLQDLVASQCVMCEGDSYRLSQRGLMIARILNLYEKISGRPMGG